MSMRVVVTLKGGMADLVAALMVQRGITEQEAIRCLIGEAMEARVQQVALPLQAPAVGDSLQCTLPNLQCPPVSSSTPQDTPVSSSTPNEEGGTIGGMEGRGEASETTEAPGSRKQPTRAPHPPPEIPPDLLAPEWRGAVEHWLAYKAERGFRYKPQGLKGLWDSLRAMGPRVGVPSIQRSTGNGWKGVKAMTEREIRELRQPPPIAGAPPPVERPSFAPLRAELRNAIFARRADLGPPLHERLSEMLVLARGVPDLTVIESEMRSALAGAGESAGV